MIEKEKPLKITIDISKNCDMTCPNCGINLIQISEKQAIYFPFKYCFECGQKLDWD